MKNIYFIDDKGELLQEIGGVNFEHITGGWTEPFEVTLKYETADEEACEVASFCEYDSADNVTNYMSDFLQVVLYVNGTKYKKQTFREWKNKPYVFVMLPNETVDIKLIFTAKKGIEAKGIHAGSFDFSFGFLE